MEWIKKERGWFTVWKCSKCGHIIDASAYPEKPDKPCWCSRKQPQNTCVCCGALIPEGRQICPKCEKSSGADAT